MARTFTATERNYISAAHTHHALLLELRDYDGDWVDRTSWLIAGTLEEDIDANSMTLNAILQRDNGSTQSLAPLREDSTLNRDNSNNYQPFLDVARQWRLSVAVVSYGTTITSGHYKEIGAGTYDVIDVEGSPIIRITGRDWGASLLDRWIETARTYGNDDDPVPMEDVIQQILDDNFGAGAITLYTPTSPSFVMEQFELKDLNVMQAVNLVAQKAGFVCKYRYDASDSLRLTLYEPDRGATAGSQAYTLAPSEYTKMPYSRMDLSGVRNEIVVRYFDVAANEVKTVTSRNATSILRYGGPHSIPRVLSLDLAEDTHITTSARATALADAILSDLESPAVEWQVEVPGLWIAQLGDYVALNSNSVIHNTTQYAGVTRIRHTFERGTMKTMLNLRGQPAGRYRTWTADERIRGVPELRIRNFRETSRTTTAVTYGFSVEGEADQFWLWYDTSLQPIGADPWQDLSTEPDKKFTKDTRSFSIDIPAVGYTTYGQLVPISATAVRGKPWRFTLQGEQIKLIQQAVILTPTAIGGTIRVRVANPIAGGNITVTPTVEGVTISPVGAQTIASGSVTSDIGTTGYVEWTYTRPDYGSGAGRVTFVATSTDRIADSDAVDIPAKDTVELQIRCTVVSTSATQQVIRVAVADVVSGPGTGDISIAYTASTGTSVSPASPQAIASASVTTSLATTGTVDFTITRPSFQTGTGRVTFTASRTGRVSVVDAVDVPAQERDTVASITRIERVSETATQIVVRVKTIIPTWTASDDGTIEVTYDAGGLTVSPVSGGTFTAEDDWATTGFIDYTITRPSQGSNPSRVAFTCTPTGMAATDSTDAVDVMPQFDRFRCRLRRSATYSLTSLATYNIEWDTEDADNGGLHSTVSNTHRITIPTGGNVGFWIFNAQITIEANGSTSPSFNVGLYNNAGTLLSWAIVEAYTAGVAIHNLTAFVAAPSVGDFFYVQVNPVFTGGPARITTGQTYFEAIHAF